MTRLYEFGYSLGYPVGRWIADHLPEWFVRRYAKKKGLA